MNEAFICDYIRTPIGRYGGALANCRPDNLAATVIRELLRRNPGLDPAGVDETLFGCANQAGEDNRNVARMAVLLAGLPESVPGITLNRLCASGMDAVSFAARMIRSGEADVVLAGGVESMSRSPFVMPKADAAFSRQAEVFDTTIGWRFINPVMREQYGVDSMPETAENVAADYGISREDQDLFALRSQQRAGDAVARGWLREEIVAVEIPQRKGEVRVVDADEHPRPDTLLEKLAGLGTPFRSGGTVTAGNSSGVNDGAACLLIASDAAVSQQGLTPLARVMGAAAAGLAPRVMGIGPIPASQKLCQRLNLSVDRFDAIELNEAFASQALAVLRGLEIADDDPRVNANGGAIALGHPLGMSGARLVGTTMRSLHDTGGKLGLATMCVGVGQGVALAIERV